MILWIDLLEDLRDLSSRVDDERRSNDAPVFPAVHAFLLPHAILLGDDVIDVREQRIGELMLLLELPMCVRRIRTNAEHLRVESLDPREGVTKRARLNGSAGRVVFGIEEQD